MDSLLSMRVFLQVVDLKSFAKAAEVLDISAPMASKHLASLERLVGARLLLRNSRKLSLTEAGARYYQHCKQALTILEEAAIEAREERERPQGRLRLTMPIWFASTTVSAWFRNYRQRFPEVELELSLSNRKVDLLEDGFDLALRVERDCPMSSLIVRPLAKVDFLLVASPNYLLRRGVPKSFEDIARLQTVLPSYTDMRKVEVFDKAGRTYMLSLQGEVVCDNTMMLKAMLEAGCGMGVLPEWLVRDALLSGRLVRVLPEFSLKQHVLYAAYVDRAFLSAKVRSMIDFLVECLSVG